MMMIMMMMMPPLDPPLAIGSLSDGSLFRQMRRCVIQYQAVRAELDRRRVRSLTDVTSPTAASSVLRGPRLPLPVT